MEVLPDHVIVLADAAERATEIDLERAEAARRRAEEMLTKARAGGTEEFDQAEAALKRSAIRIKVAQRRRRRDKTPPPTN
jgi:F-type H+-transporting ATPase subunit epsilon